MRLSRKLAAASVATVLAAVSFAPAAGANPTPEYAQFIQCHYADLSVSDCVHSVFSGGSLTIGAKSISLQNPVTFQGGVKASGEFLGAENGITLSKTPQPVQGGLVGVTAPTSWPVPLQEWFNNLIAEGFTGVNATVELAEPPTSIAYSLENLVLEEGVALGLPVKIKLENPALGSNCYIGSTTPIQLDLTTGPSGTLTGTTGSLTFNGAVTIATFTGIELVDGTFTAPAAEGCGGAFSTYIDPLVNSIFELPAVSEENAATFEGVFQDASAAAVRAP